MSRTTRRLAPTALLLGLALFLAVAPAQARESPSFGWFSSLTQQLMQWTAGWWGWPVKGTSANVARRPPAKTSPPITIDCGIQIDPSGACSPAASPQH